MTHQNLWDKEEQSVSHVLPLLTPEEAQVYKCLQDHLRLEQEHIRFFTSLLEALAEPSYEGDHHDTSHLHRQSIT